MTDNIYMQINNFLNSKYQNCKDEIMNISLDDTNNRPCFTCNDRRKYFNYDKITKKAYNKYVSLPCSPDLLMIKNDKLIFIEFKAGRFNENDLKFKMLEGCFIALYKILSSIISNDFNNIWKIQKEFILVYTKDTSAKRYKEKFYLNASGCFFGLDKYKNTFFQNVTTHSSEKFKKIFNKIKVGSLS